MTKFLKILAVFIVLSLSSSAQIPTTSGFYFDGIDDRVSIPNIPAYNNLFNKDFSIDFWCKPDSIFNVFGEYSVITIGDGISTSRFKIILRPNSIAGYFFYPSGSGSGFLNSLPNSITDGKCHHFAFVFKDKIGKWYTDGASYSNYTNSINLPVIQNPNIIIGQDYINPQNNSFKGLISRVRVWSKALTQSEILNSYANPIIASLNVLLADWKLENKYKQKVEDYALFNNFGYKGFGSSVESSDPGYSAGCLNCLGKNISIQKLTSTSFCAGDSSTLKVIIPANYSCQWYKDGKVIAGQTDSIIYGKTNGVFSAILTDSSGCKKYSDAVTLKIYFSDVGNIIRKGSNPNLHLSYSCWWQGKKDTLQVGYHPTYNYQWVKFGVPIPNATSYKLLVADTGEYACRVSIGTCMMETYKFYIRPLRATIEPLSSPVTCLDTIVSLEVDIPASYSPNYVWKANGVVIPNANTRYLTTSLTGNITCTVTDTNYCPLPAVSPALYVAHNQNPNLLMGAYGFPLISGGSINDCSGLSGILFELVDQYGFTFGNSDLLSVNWYGDYPFFQLSQSSIVADRSGYYGVSYTSVCGSGSDSKSVYIAGPNAIKPNINGANSHCSVIQLQLDNPFFTWQGYQWYWNNSLIPGATNPGYNATKAGDYFCVLYNSCDSVVSYSRYANILFDNYKIFPVNGTAICNGVPKQLYVGGGNSFQWKKNGTTISGATSSVYTAITPGTYVCLISGNCGATSDTIIITNGTALVPPVGCISGEDTICPPSNNQVYSVSSVAGALHYTWILPTGAFALSNLDSISINLQFQTNFYGGMLYFLGINDCGTDTLCSFYIHSLRPKVPVLLTGDLYGLCGLTETYRCSSDSLVSSYVWTFPPSATIVSGQGTDSVEVLFGPSTISGNLVVYGISTCMNSLSLSLPLHSYPGSAGNISGSSSVCANQTNLTYSVNPVVGTYYYLWTLPPGAIQLSPGNSNSITISMGTSSGQVTVKPISNCSNGTLVFKQVNVVCRENDELGLENEFQIVSSVENGTLQFQMEGLTEVGSVKVVNTIGQLFSEHEVLADEVIQVSGLSPGIYFISCYASGKKQTRKVVIY